MTHSPFTTFGSWLSEAQATEPNDPNAMTLATVSPSGQPSARTVLMKAWDERGFVFYGNLNSRKSEELKQNPAAALLFHWKTLHRQIRIEGHFSPVTNSEADAYFATRPRGSQLGAWTSAQSKPLPDRETFDREFQATETRFENQPVPRPPFWSGWRLTPTYFEFWQDQQYRLHDRITYTRNGDLWATGRLYP